MILITEFMNSLSVNKLKQNYEVIYDPNLVENQKNILPLLKSTKALIVRNRTKVTHDLIDHAPKLLCIGRLGVGLDNIDIDACKKRKITVFPAVGANTKSVVEYVITSSMYLMREAYDFNSEMLKGDWPRQKASGNEINNKRLGLIGFGEIAQETNKVAKLLGMKSQAYDPYLPYNSKHWKETKKVELEELLKTSDVISLHTPLTKQTYHLLNEKNLDLVKSSSIIINASRGGTVDEIALCKKLKKGELRGAAIDVYENEPLNSNNSNMFKGIKNLILTPHIAGVTVESNERVSQMIAKKISNYLELKK